MERTTDTVLAYLARLQTGANLTERDRHAWRVLVEELETLPGEPMSFAKFRKIASEIAGLRTVPRLTSAAVAPGVARVRIVAPHSLGYRDYRWIFAPGFADGEFPARFVPNPLLTDETVSAVNKRIKPRRLFTAQRSESEGAALPVHNFGFGDETDDADVSGKHVGRGDEVSVGVCEGDCEAL